MFGNQMLVKTKALASCDGGDGYREKIQGKKVHMLILHTKA